MNRWKLLVAVCALGLGSSAIAGSYSCSKGQVTVPCFAKGWHFLAEGQYLQHTNDDLDFARNTEFLAYDNYTVDKHYTPSFRLEAGWHFGQGNDVTADWSHFDHNYNGRAPESGNGRRYGDADFKGNIFNVEFGQLFKVADNGDLRLHFGFQVFRLDHHFKVASANGAGALQEGYKYITDFHGIGPRVGVDWIRPLPHGFTFVAHGAGMLLVGDLDSALMIHQGNNDGWTPYVSQHGRRTVVPGLEGRTAVRWSHVMDKGVVSIDLGWHYAAYYQSVHHVRVSSSPRPTQNISNFAHQGPVAAISFSERV